MDRRVDVVDHLRADAAGQCHHHAQRRLRGQARGAAVRDVPITWSYTYVPDDTIAAPGATGVIDRGLFAAEVPGRYTLLATAGPTSARKVIGVSPRDVRKRISVTGRGSISHVHTSDLWPWTGKDGRDYALVGTSKAALESLVRYLAVELAPHRLGDERRQRGRPVAHRSFAAVERRPGIDRPSPIRRAASGSAC